ncbi:MAG: hypothetical protein VR65_22565 [Desulfobulbaceae bacterium BRH_c16a]|nr:MAG: hypothetical protein VR65_22565 [Desulfobulbaceae bacterium BRH_c16a]
MKYIAYNLTIESELPLPLPVDDSGTPADMAITIAKIDEPEKLCRTYDGVWYAHGEKSLLLRWDIIGTFLIQRGEKIILDPVSDLGDLSLSLVPMLGTVIAVAIFQRGLTTLHGSSVAVNGKAVIFLGDKGKGKSTLAAYCHHRGYLLVSDDICAIDNREDRDRRRPCLYPSFPSVKLWPDVMHYLGMNESQHKRVHPSIHKRIISFNKDFADQPLEIAAIILLEKGDILHMTKIGGHKTVPNLLPHFLINRFPDDQPGHLQESVFFQLNRLIQSIPVYKLHRPHDLSLLPDSLSLINKTLF